MEWTVLENHFLLATRQEPGPYSDEVIEWDHSRYTRALGLLDEPGLHDLTPNSCALLCTEPRRWDAAERRYRLWAEEVGWSVLRVSARPTVAVPDPVVYALGRSICGADGLVFARSGRQGRPRVDGRRVRPPGTSIPLAPGDRWLIAADRVRRRVRNEAATRGLVILIDEAHKLSASAMSILGYLMDAHRGWRARMLARDAKVYVIFATTPEHEESVQRMLERFSHDRNVPVARERVPQPTDPKQAPVRGTPLRACLDAEQEDLLAALAAAPLALTHGDVAALFGKTVKGTVENLIERGALHRRQEDHHTCLVPDPAFTQDLPTPPDRVLRALLDRYRYRQRQGGHEHLVFATAALAFRLNQPLRAAAYLGCAAPGDTVTIACDLLEFIESHLEQPEAHDALHAGHLAMWLALRAHQRNYKGAQHLAAELTRKTIRSSSDFSRVLTFMLSMGRTHADQILHTEFWATLEFGAVDQSLADALCVLMGLYLFGTSMSTSDVRERLSIATECLSHAVQNDDQATVELLACGELLRVRYQRWLETSLKSEAIQIACNVTPRSISALLRAHVVPGYLVGSVLFADLYAGHIERGLCSDRGTTFNMMASTGNCSDQRITLSNMINEVPWLLVRSICDETVLLLPRGASRDRRAHVRRVLDSAFGLRATQAMSGVVFGAKGDVPGQSALEAAQMCVRLILRGDYEGARRALKIGLESAPRHPIRRAMLLQLHAHFCLKSLEWGKLDVTAELLRRSAAMLPRWLKETVGHFVEAARCLVGGESSRARTLLEGCLAGAGGAGTGRALALVASEQLTEVRRLAVWARSLGQRKKPQALLVDFRKTMMEGSSPAAAPMPSFTLRDRLHAIVLALELWAEAGIDDEHVTLLSLWLHKHACGTLGSDGAGLIRTLPYVAPRFYTALRDAARRQLKTDVSSPDSVETALWLLREASGDPDRLLGLGGQWANAPDFYTVEVPHTGSCVRRARLGGKSWYEDGSVYWACFKALGSEFRVGGRVGIGAGIGRPIVVHVKVKSRRKLQLSVALESDRQKIEREPTGDSRRGRRSGKHKGAAAIMGSSAAAEEIRRFVEVAARCDYPVLVTGETGTGKEVVARAIHASSRRGDGVLVVADCGSVTDSLLESELFGHRKGAFTGAESDRSGYFELAHGSTLFLDEIDSMTPRMQAALLRVLDTGEYRPVGVSDRLYSDYRIVSAGLPRLSAMVEDGAFREDLFYRLSTLHFEIPPLRERGEDAEELAVEFAREIGFRLSALALSEIRSYGWPGNIRELRHVLEVASLHASDGVIGGIAGLVTTRRATAGGRSVSGSDASAEATWERVRGSLGGAFGALTFAGAAGISRRSAQRYLSHLARAGFVARSGAGRATHYRRGGVMSRS